MTRIALQILFYLAATFIVLFILVWLLLAAPMFSGMRTSFIEDVLTKEIGQPIHIKKDASVQLGLVSRVHASGVEIPSVAMPDVMLAELNLLEIDLSLPGLLSGEIDLDNLIVDGLQVRLLRTADDATSWSDAAPSTDDASAAPDEQSGDADLLDFLKDREFAFSNVGIEIDNAKTGFEFSFQLETLELANDAAGDFPTIQGRGKLNGQAVTIDGTFPDDKPFAFHSNIAGIDLSYVGQSTLSDDGNAHVGDLTVQVASFGTLLDVLKLERVTDGKGALQADVHYDVGAIQLENVNVEVDVESGEHAEIHGSIENLLSFHGITLDVSSRLYPEGEPPARAQKISELELTEIEARIVGDKEGFEFETLHFGTNAVTPELKSVGPVSIERVVRTPEGQLAMRGIRLLAGPEDAPFLDARSNIENLLQLKNIDVSGTADLPASLILAGAVVDPEAFGRVAVEFAADDSAGHPTLKEFSAQTDGTDLWSLESQVHVGDITGLTDVDFSLAVEIADRAKFLAAFGGKSSNDGSLGLGASLKGNGRDFETSLALVAGTSDFKAVWQTNIADGAPTLTGLISSELVDLDDMANVIEDLIDFTSSLADTPDAGVSDDSPLISKDQLQPLVLPEAEDDTAASNELEIVAAAPDRQLQPLVLPEAEESVSTDVPEDVADAPARQLQPLVLSEAELDAQSNGADDGGADSTDDPDIADFFDLPKLMKVSGVDLAIKLAQISGQEGISKIDSTLTVADGKGNLGPLDLAYGGGHASVSAEMNFVETPDLVTLSGSTGGWDFGKIMDAVGAGISAYGVFNAKFDITAQYASLDTFTQTMTGKAHVSLSRGKIETSLLELAGLGVLPWLFSKEAGQGFTNIVCMEAPLSIKSGRVTSNSIVVETQAVQVVVKGGVNLKNETISLRAEPRPVGKAQARSAWPVEVTGSLSSPKIDVKPGSAPAKPQTGGGLFAPKPEVKSDRVPCRPDARQ